MEQTRDTVVHFRRQPWSELAADNTSYRSDLDRFGNRDRRCWWKGICLRVSRDLIRIIQNSGNLPLTSGLDSAPTKPCAALGSCDALLGLRERNPRSHCHAD